MNNAIVSTDISPFYVCRSVSQDKQCLCVCVHSAIVFLFSINNDIYYILVCIVTLTLVEKLIIHDQKLWYKGVKILKCSSGFFGSDSQLSGLPKRHLHIIEGPQHHNWSLQNIQSYICRRWLHNIHGSR